MTGEANQKPNDAARLRVGALVCDYVVPVWITQMLDEVAACPELELTGVAVAPRVQEGAGTPSPGLLARGFALSDERLFRKRAALLEPSDVRAWGSARGVVVATAALPGALVEGEAAEAKAAAAVDVVLDLCGAGASAIAREGARLAVWWLEGVPTGTRHCLGEVPGVAVAALGDSAVVTFDLLASRTHRDESVVLDTAVCPTHPSSGLMTAAYLVASATQLIVERLRNATEASLLRGQVRELANPRSTEAAVEQQRPRPPARAPIDLASSGAAGYGFPSAVVFLARASARQVRKAVREQEWHLLIGQQDPERRLPDPSTLRPILPPVGRYWADPFVVTYEAHTYIFFEEFLYDARRGRIAVMTLDEMGGLSAPRTALELDTHLSYPFVFVRDGRLYMVPESAASGSLDLYECVEPPCGWVWRRSLLAGEQVTDASLVEWKGRWWMFAGLKKPRDLQIAELLVLYMTDDPVNGVWRKHPGSPLLADVTNARPAGAPFVRDGRLYRLAQDGSGGYGWGIAVNEVLSLTPCSYEERRVAVLRPGWARGLRGTHTLNRAGPNVVMDACRMVWRNPLRERSDTMLG